MTELEKLKTELMKKGISVDDSHSDSWMKRLRFEINGVLHSAISGDFSYGGAKGLIEVYIPSTGKIENLKNDMCDTVTKFTARMCLVVENDCAKCPIYRLKQEINLVGYSCANTLETIINAGIDAMFSEKQATRR